jgi:hypothetical protein
MADDLLPVKGPLNSRVCRLSMTFLARNAGNAGSQQNHTRLSTTFPRPRQIPHLTTPPVQPLQGKVAALLSRQVPLHPPRAVIR